jgi:hypothetical protein
MPGRSLDELRQAIDHLAPIVGPALTVRLLADVPLGGPESLTTREALSVLTAQLTVLTQFSQARSA